MRLWDTQLLIRVLLPFLTLVPAFSQSGGRLSAREIFYSAPPQPEQKKPVQRSAKPKAKASAESARTQTIVPPVDSVKRQGGSLEVSYDESKNVPLGLRYSILKKESTGLVEVDPETVFYAGDKIQLRVDVNTAGYLYIISRGSSGNWKPLFPAPEIAGGSNRVQKGTPYDIPSGYVFTFDEQAGKEKLFIVFSRQPVSDLEELIYSLSKGQGKKPEEPERPGGAKLLLAQANIKDTLIERLRTVYSRDLIVEKVNDSSAPPQSKQEKEKAVYVVNPSHSADTRLVADITLDHR